MPVNTQSRDQLERSGGNCAKGAGESHGAALSEQLDNGSDKGNVKAGNDRKEGGQSNASPSIEKHGQKKMMGKKSVGGKVVGEAPVVEADVQVSERRHGAGNSKDGGREHHVTGKERISASVNRS